MKFDLAKLRPALQNRRYRAVATAVALIVAIALVWFLFPRALPKTASLGGVSLNMEYAVTDTELAVGLSGRASIPDNYGMLFVFNAPNKHPFWAKGMLVPFDLFWIDTKGQVIGIETNIRPESYPNVFYPPSPVRYVLETRAGFADDHAIAVGSWLTLKNLIGVSK